MFVLGRIVKLKSVRQPLGLGRRKGLVEGRGRKYCMGIGDSHLFPNRRITNQPPNPFPLAAPPPAPPSPYGSSHPLPAFFPRPLAKESRPADPLFTNPPLRAIKRQEGKPCRLFSHQVEIRRVAPTPGPASAFISARHCFGTSVPKQNLRNLRNLRLARLWQDGPFAPHSYPPPRPRKAFTRFFLPKSRNRTFSDSEIGLLAGNVRFCRLLSENVRGGKNRTSVGRFRTRIGHFRTFFAGVSRRHENGPLLRDAGSRQDPDVGPLHDRAK